MGSAITSADAKQDIEVIELGVEVVFHLFLDLRR